MSEQSPNPKLTVEEQLTLKMNDIMPNDWMDTPVGQIREKRTSLDGRYSIHLQQSKGQNGIVTSRLQVGEWRERMPYNRWVEWSPNGEELTQNERPLPIDIDQLHRILDNISDQKSRTISDHQSLDSQPRQESLPGLEQEEDDTRWERIIAASRDKRVVAFWLDYAGSEESVISQLQPDYNLSEADATEALYMGLAELSEIVDHDSEA